ncbi:unnamed protein product [Caenorhabditis sp. 36 PRJEB53466]|nr:unnamed protein product [Caenorhabditis sp. 36 PRJEB53466]
MVDKTAKNKSAKTKTETSTETTGKKKELDVYLIIERLLNPANCSTDRKPTNISSEEVWQLCSAMTDVFKSEDNVVEVGGATNVIGDLHGHLTDLVRALMARTADEMREDRKDVDRGKRRRQPFASQRYVFLGDYLHNERRPLEVICLLFALKLAKPNSYILLRGSTECPSNNLTFFHQLEMYYKAEGNAEKLWRKFNETFSWMPLIAIVGTRILCVHGGISPHFKTFDDVRMIKRPLMNPLDDPLATDLIWSDTLDYDFIHVPSSKPKYEMNDLRHVSVFYNEAAVKEFCNRLGLKMIIRSHLMVPFGFRFFADKMLVTIFTASNYRHKQNNGAMIKISAKGKISIVSLISLPAHNDDFEENAQPMEDTGGEK